MTTAEAATTRIYEEFEMDAPVFNTAPQFIPIQNFTHGDEEMEAYWFHPDHLGSSNYITNFEGQVSQHMEYFAFGESFVEEYKNSHNSPYKFNGKELDEETGLYYYGARYYNPRTSIWLSVDPLAEDMPSWSPYNYAFSNPLRFTDPTGMKGEESEWVPNSDGDVTKDQKLKLDNVYTRSIKASNGTELDADPDDYYNCFTSAIRGAQGKEIRRGWDEPGYESPDGMLLDATPTDEDNAIFGKTIIRMVNKYNSPSHAVAFYGKSNDGTIYVYSKNGYHLKPKVVKLNSLSYYGKVQGLPKQSIIRNIYEFFGGKPAPTTYDSGYYNLNE